MTSTVTSLPNNVQHCTITAMSTMSASEARDGLPALLDRVESGDEVVITRHGRAVAVVLRPDTVRSRRRSSAAATVDHLRERLERARDIPLSSAPHVSKADADELAQHVRAGRDAR
jgi:antitoxin (DNA-binding transcriptional repressor) of toxin-antitoxin stability system